MTTVLLKNIYRNGNSVKTMFRNGQKIYQQLFKLIFSVDTDEISFENSGGTYTINITSNERWTMTVPNWLTASSLSGTGNASIILSTNSVPDSKLEGEIIINCVDRTHTISVNQAGGIDLTEPLTFEIISGGTLYWKKTRNSSSSSYLNYSKNNGASWTQIQSTTGGTAIPVSTGDVVKVKIIRGYFYNHNYFGNDNTVKYKVSGNVMSLIYGDSFVGKTSFPNTSYQLSIFQNCSGLVDAGRLGLPATTLTNNCYISMFSNCRNLTTAPALPATTLTQSCYQNMFYGCTSLTAAPALPATTLAVSCYGSMFQGCTSLTTAPALPATTLANTCYSNMFQGCTNLNYIKCLATDISASDCTDNWVSGVAASGTFEGNTNTSWAIGNSGIPTGWESNIPLLAISKTSARINNTKPSASIDIYLTQGSWTASTQMSWITITPSTGNMNGTITITGNNIPSTVDTGTIIIITSNGLSATISVTNEEQTVQAFTEWFTDNQSALESDSRSVDFAQTLYLPTQFNGYLSCTLTTADDSTYFRVEMMGGDNIVSNEMTYEEITPSQEVIDGVTYDVFELGVATVFEDYWSAEDMNSQLQDYGSEVYFS